MKATGIYAIEHRENGYAYVGSAVGIESRWKMHRWSLARGRHASQHLQRAWDKCGAAAFRFVRLEECSREMLVFKEQTWMDRYHHVIVYVVVRRWRRWYASVNRRLAIGTWPVELVIVQDCDCATDPDVRWCRTCGGFTG